METGWVSSLWDEWKSNESKYEVTRTRVGSWILILYVNEILDRIFFPCTLFSGVILSPPLLSPSFFPLLGWKGKEREREKKENVNQMYRAVWVWVFFACHCFSIWSIHPFIQSHASRNICPWSWISLSPLPSFLFSISLSLSPFYFPLPSWSCLWKGGEREGESNPVHEFWCCARWVVEWKPKMSLQCQKQAFFSFYSEDKYQMYE